MGLERTKQTWDNLAMEARRCFSPIFTRLVSVSCVLVNYFRLNINKHCVCLDTWCISELQAFVIALGQCAYEFFPRRTKMLTFSGLSWESDYSPHRYLAPLHIDLFQLHLTDLHWQRPTSFLVAQWFFCWWRFTASWRTSLDLYKLPVQPPSEVPAFMFCIANPHQVYKVLHTCLMSW